jgi:cytochrome P450 family 138
MSDATTVDTEAPSATGAPPPAVRLPKPVQMVLMAGFRRRFLRSAVKRHGSVFAINVPFFGRSVVISDPALARKVFLASTDDLINVQPNLSRLFGPGSVFALDRREHRARASCWPRRSTGRASGTTRRSSKRRRCARRRHGPRAASSPRSNR